MNGPFQFVPMRKKVNINKQHKFFNWLIIFLSKYSQSVRIPAWIAYENMQALRRFIDGVDVVAQVKVCSSGMEEK